MGYELCISPVARVADVVRSSADGSIAPVRVRGHVDGAPVEVQRGRHDLLHQLRIRLRHVPSCVFFTPRRPQQGLVHLRARNTSARGDDLANDGVASSLMVRAFYVPCWCCPGGVARTSV
jgi:hypothetical protein